MSAPFTAIPASPRACMTSWRITFQGYGIANMSETPRRVFPVTLNVSEPSLRSTFAARPLVGLKVNLRSGTNGTVSFDGRRSLKRLSRKFAPCNLAPYGHGISSLAHPGGVVASGKSLESITTDPVMARMPRRRTPATMLSANPRVESKYCDSIVGSPMTRTTIFPSSTLSQTMRPTADTGVAKRSEAEARLSNDADVTLFITDAGTSERSMLALTTSRPQRRSYIHTAVRAVSIPATFRGKAAAVRPSEPTSAKSRERIRCFMVIRAFSLFRLSCRLRSGRDVWGPRWPIRAPASTRRCPRHQAPCYGIFR